jgi:uridine phosphorylase
VKDPGTIHLHPTAPLATRALLPGDPGRALALAQSLLVEPLMFNHHRGLWGYTGVARADGEPLTIQSTGIGGPSAAIVFQELVALGLGTAIRVGTCGALQPEIRTGEMLIARETIAADGASRALGAPARVSADAALTAELQRSAPSSRTGTIVTTDLFYEPARTDDSEQEALSVRERQWRQAGALAVEMEAATLLTLGYQMGVPVACVLVVSDGAPRGRRTPLGMHWRERIDQDELREAAERMGAVAVAALKVEDRSAL